MKLKMKTFKTFVLGACLAALFSAGVYAQDQQCEPCVAPCDPVQIVEEVKPCKPVADVEETVAPCAPVEATPEVPVYEPQPCEPVTVVEEAVVSCAPVVEKNDAQTCRSLPVRDIPYKHRVVYVAYKPKRDWDCDCGRGLRRGVVPGKDGKCRCWKCEHEIRVAEVKARREANVEHRRCTLERVGAKEFNFSYKSVVEIKREVK